MAKQQSAAARDRRRKVRRRRIAVGGACVAVLAAGGSVALAEASNDGADPVTAEVTNGSITQTITASGTIAPAARSSVAFPNPGTVTKVSVVPGQVVSEGQVLAQLDTSSLQSTVDSANAAVASARQKLAADESGQTSTGSSSSTAAGSGTGASTTNGVSNLVADDAAATDTGTTVDVVAPTTPAGGATSTGSTSGAKTGATTSALRSLIAQIQAEQKKLVAAQHAVDQDQAVVDAKQKVVDVAVIENSRLRNAEKSACDTDAPSTSPSSSSSSSPSPSSACTTADSDYEAYADTLSADVGALDVAITAQDAAIASNDREIKALDALLAKLPAVAAASSTGTTSGTGSTGTGSGGTGSGGTGSGGAGSSGSGTSGSGSTGTGSSGSGSSSTGSGGTGSGGTGSSGTGTTGSGASTGSSSTSTTTTASASQLAADQAAIDSANAQLALARQNLAAATLKSPLAGTVASVGLTAGGSSNGQSVTILGTGNQLVSIAVPLSEISQVKTGQAVTVAVDGRTGTLKGTVTKIGLLSTTASSLTTFPVTITLAGGAPSLHVGVGADVTVTTGTKADAVLVPNSAITTVGTRRTVTVLTAGKSKVVQITVGLVGADTSQVTAGLTAGETVQLADPKLALPSSATSTSTTTGGVGTFRGQTGGFGNFRPGG